MRRIFKVKEGKMKRVFLILILICAALFTDSAIAADKVVVVPLGGGSHDSWLRVYDDNGVFLGFTNIPSYIMPYPSLITSKKFTTTLIRISNDRFFFFPSSNTYHTTPDCSGKKYFNFPYIYEKIGSGMVVDVITSPAPDSSAYYIQYNKQPVIIPAGNTYYGMSYDTPCTATTSTSDTYLYEMTPNDSNITGLKESYLYKLPLDYQFTLPASP